MFRLHESNGVQKWSTIDHVTHFSTLAFVKILILHILPSKFQNVANYGQIAQKGSFYKLIPEIGLF